MHTQSKGFSVQDAKASTVRQTDVKMKSNMQGIMSVMPLTIYSM